MRLFSSGCASASAATSSFSSSDSRPTPSPPSSKDVRRTSTRRLRHQHRSSRPTFVAATAVFAAALAIVATPSADAQSQFTQALTPPSTAALASPISTVLDSAYVGFGIEPTSVFEFAGGRQRNNLTFNLLSNLANYTGKPPHLRIGGNAGDRQVYSASSLGYQYIANPNPRSDLTNFDFIGPNFFQAFNNFPQDTPITYQLNLAYQGSGWQDLIVQTAGAALDAMTSVNIVGFEIGNEPDLFVENGYRNSSTWSAPRFALQWQAIAVDIYNQVLAPRGIGTNFFEPAGTATTATTNGMPYRIENLARSAIGVDNGIYISGWNQHDYYYYLGVSTYTLTTALLLDLSTTISQFAEWKDQSAEAYSTGKPYYLREMNSIGPTGLEEISPTFAQTLWVFNFHMYAATVGVANVHMHMTTYSWGAAWLPINNGSVTPHVRSSYYAYAAVAQIVGATCDTQIASVALRNMPSGYNNNLAAYTKYQGGTLRTLIAVNSRPAYTGSSANTVTFAYSVPTWAGQTVWVSYLSASGVDATDNTTWNGLSYEVSGTGVPTSVSSAAPEQLVVPAGGLLNIAVRDSQVAVVNLGYRIGTTNSIVNATNCNPSAVVPGATTAVATFSTVTTNPFDGAFGSLSHLKAGALLSMAMLAGGMAVFL